MFRRLAILVALLEVVVGFHPPHPQHLRNAFITGHNYNLPLRQEACRAGETSCAVGPGCCQIGSPCSSSNGVWICVKLCNGGPTCTQANKACCDIGMACNDAEQNCTPAPGATASRVVVPLLTMPGLTTTSAHITPSLLVPKLSTNTFLIASSPTSTTVIPTASMSTSTSPSVRTVTVGVATPTLASTGSGLRIFDTAPLTQWLGLGFLFSLIRLVW